MILVATTSHLLILNLVYESPMIPSSSDKLIKSSWPPWVEPAIVPNITMATHTQIQFNNKTDEQCQKQYTHHGLQLCQLLRQRKAQIIFALQQQ